MVKNLWLKSRCWWPVSVIIDRYSHRKCISNLKSQEFLSYGWTSSKVTDRYLHRISASSNLDPLDEILSRFHGNMLSAFCMSARKHSEDRKIFVTGGFNGQAQVESSLADGTRRFFTSDDGKISADTTNPWTFSRTIWEQRLCQMSCNNGVISAEPVARSGFKSTMVSRFKQLFNSQWCYPTVGNPLQETENPRDSVSVSNIRGIQDKNGLTHIFGEIQLLEIIYSNRLY